MTREWQSKGMMLLSMVIFGTIGLMRHFVCLPSGLMACCRGLIGAVCLLPVALHRWGKDSVSPKDGLLLFLGGTALGLNWMLLFEAYRYTPQSVAVICYYMAPVFVMVAAPLLLKERLTVPKLMCVLTALVGVILVSGIIGNTWSTGREWIGILLGLGAAVLYASMTLVNKKITHIDAYVRTTVELTAASVVLIPYVFATGEWASLSTANPMEIGGLLVLGVVHTGVAYALYFGSLRHLSAQTVALCSYLDPALTVLLSAVVLQEPLALLGWVGAVLVLASTAVGESLLLSRLE